MRLAQAVVSLVALAAVVWWATRQQAPELPSTPAGLALLAGALAIYALATLARGERWHRILAHEQVPAARAETYRLTTVGYMGNNVLPARGGDLLRGFLLAPLAAVRKRAVLGTIVAERLLDAAALGLIFLVVAVGILRDADLPAAAWFVAAAIAAAALVGAVGVTAIRRLAVLQRVRDFVRPLAAATRSLPSGHGAQLLLLSLGIWALEALVYLAVARAAGLDFGPWDAVYVMALTNLLALVPAGPGYVGTFDAAVVVAARSLGAEGGEALAYLLLLRFALFVPITAVGFGFLAARYGGWSGLRAAGEGDAALR